MLNHGSLFSGIGGFDLAAEWVGWNNVFHCEINDFCRKILKYYWKNSFSYEDIKQTDFSIHRGQIDVLTGGFPCQPFSLAGKRAGSNDERYLWNEMLRAIREIQPNYIVAENVPGLINWNRGLVFEQICASLEHEGYEVQSLVLPACGKNAPHKRDRVWIVAHANRNAGCRTALNYDSAKQKIQKWAEMEQSGTANNLRQNVANTSLFRRQQIQQEVKPERAERTLLNSFNEPSYWAKFPIEEPIYTGNDGVSDRLDGITIPKWLTESVGAAGNAIVPQVALSIFNVINKLNNI